MLAIDGGTASEAVDVHFEERGVMNETVNGGECHGWVREDLSPFAKGLVGRDYVELERFPLLNHFTASLDGLFRSRSCLQTFEQPFDRLHITIYGRPLVVG